MFGRSFQRDASQLLLLSVLAEKPLYGYAMTKEVAAKSGGELKLTPGVLYPLLAKLERSGFIDSSWETIRSDRRAVSDVAANEGVAADEDEAAGRKRKWYRLTDKGRAELASALKDHHAYVNMLAAFLPRSGGQEETSS